MPGVLVEVTSPALIEKVRTAVTDSNGQYRITNLPVGTYTVTFTLEGFTKQQRNNIVADDRLHGAGERDDDRWPARRKRCRSRGATPTVDVQNARQVTTFEGDDLRSCRRRATSAAS